MPLGHYKQPNLSFVRGLAYHSLEDLQGRLWQNQGEIPNNGIDDDGNGLVDDVHGYDFADGDGDPSDDDGHGTHCAGGVFKKLQSIDK